MADAARIDVDQQDTFVSKPGIRRLEVLQRSDEEPCTDQHHQAQGDLGDDEGGRHSPAGSADDARKDRRDG
jgi:hypothetical protein